MAKKKLIKTPPPVEVKKAKIKKPKKHKEPNPVGAPSLYKPEYPQMLLDYFGEPAYKEDSQGRIRATDFKSLAGFAIKVGVHRDTLHEWAKEHAEFSDAYARAKDFQENFLSVNGAKSLINAQFSIFIAKNVLNWRDKREVEVTEKPLEKLSDEELDQLIKEKGGKK